jgi:lipopolysaccharide assembly protein A
MRFFSWLLRAFIFFTLFAFALNNLQPVTLHWFFGVTWTTPMVIVVLAAFAAGCAVGVLAMLARAWPFNRRNTLPMAPVAPAPTAPTNAPTNTSANPSEAA